MKALSENLDRLDGILKERFGFSSFVGPQRDVLAELARGGDALLLMPTGHGKSLCYQLPAALTGGLVLVLSPLIALMEDQTLQARQMGLRATYINSSLSKEDREARLAQVVRGEISLLFVTPERFRQPEFLAGIAQVSVELLAVDEAHCVSLWGHDFRPDYSKIHQIRELLGRPPTLCLTATATTATQKDILQQVGIPEARVFSAGFRRDNIALKVLEVNGRDEKLRALVGLAHAIPGPKILYCSLITTVLQMRGELERLGIVSMIYHGELPPAQKRRTLKDFLKTEDGLLIATPAFGLGINKPNIRAVIHAEVPGSLEAYYQEVGRGGRDGRPAEGILLFDEDDVAIQREFIEWGNPDAEYVARLYRALVTQGHLLQTEGVRGLKDIMSFHNRRDHRVESTLQILQRIGAVEPARDTKVGFRPAREPDRAELEEMRSAERKKVLLAKLLEAVRYVQQPNCRLQVILDYFSESSAPCGRCDRCRERGG